MTTPKTLYKQYKHLQALYYHTGAESLSILLHTFQIALRLPHRYRCDRCGEILSEVDKDYNDLTYIPTDTHVRHCKGAKPC